MNVSKFGSHISDCDIDSMNSLLEEELTAIDTYDQALAKFDEQYIEMELEFIREEHVQAAAALRQQIRAHGGVPSDDAGIWGAFAYAVTGAGKMLAPQTVLAALIQGEATGIRDFEKALDNGYIAQDCRTLIRMELLPKSYMNLAALDRMIHDLQTTA